MCSMCRQVNDTGANISRQYPKRFWICGSALPWVREAKMRWKGLSVSLAQRLCVCAVIIMGIILERRSLMKFLNFLNRLDVPAILHPSAPLVYPKSPVTGKILPMYEFITDTTRTVLDVFASETLVRYSKVKLVVPHSGSCLPLAIDRFRGIMSVTGRTVEIR